jgi:DNA-directed RNA polymerase subunit K/omega
MVEMDEMSYSSEPPDTPTETVDAPVVPLEPAVPISSRFLFVDVAALRAKQLRRGASVRYRAEQATMPLKPERLAMEEVRRRLVPYTVTPPSRATQPEAEG